MDNGNYRGLFARALIMKETEQPKEKQTKPKFQILIARYNEPLDYLQYIPKRENRDYEVIVSNSGNPEDKFKCDRTIVRENIGREAGHYLDFMASEYKAMADVVVFIQAGCFHHAVINTILELFWGDPNFPHPMSFLGTNNIVCIPKIQRWSEAEHIMKSTWQDKPWPKEVDNGGAPWIIGGGAQFYIKKEIVLKRPPEHYLRAKECAKDPESKLAHVLEFHWPNIFDLSCLHK
jgi:hypothetical protein